MKDNNDQNPTNNLRNTLIFQFDIAWQMLKYHFTDLEEEEGLWKPSTKGLQVTNTFGIWKVDWPDNENYDMGPSSIAWVTWHIIYWWSMVFDYSFGQGTLEREEVQWPGSMNAVIAKIEQLQKDWLNIMNTLPEEEFLSTHKTRWPFEERPFYELAAWLNLELMKNASEIGYGRFLYASRNKEI
jgi:hypothetical protein